MAAPRLWTPILHLMAIERCVNVRSWPVAEGCDFRKQDTQATAIGKSRRSLAASAPDPDKPLTISHLQSFEAFIPEHLEKFQFFILF